MFHFKMVSVQDQMWSRADIANEWRRYKCIFLYENISIAIKISTDFVTWGLIDNSSALAQIMTWCRTDNKPLCELMMAENTEA